MIETQNELDNQVDDFTMKIVDILSKSFASMFIVIGDQMNIFKVMEAHGQVTSDSLADALDYDERYIREWLNGSYAAGVIEYQADSGYYYLPEYAIPVLAKDNTPYSLNVLFHQMFPTWFVIDDIMKAFKQGGGVPHHRYDKRIFDGIARETNNLFQNELVSWIERLPTLNSQLLQGSKVLDVGSGQGTALFVLAKEFPNSTFVGVDIHQPSIDFANNKARELGLSDRVFFIHHDLHDELSGQYDLITAFDVIHDLGCPQIIFNNISTILKPGGTFLIKDFVTSDNTEDNVGPFSTILYGFSLAYCLTSSLSTGNQGLGTMGLTWNILNELADNAGFSKTDILVQEDEMNIIYHLTR